MLKILIILIFMQFFLLLQAITDIKSIVKDDILNLMIQSAKSENIKLKESKSDTISINTMEVTDSLLYLFLQNKALNIEKKINSYPEFLSLDFLEYLNNSFIYHDMLFYQFFEIENVNSSITFVSSVDSVEINLSPSLE